MLKINVRGENIEVTGSIREYVEKKLAKLEKYFEDTSSSTAHVNIKDYSDKKCKVEVKIPLPYLVLRAEETSPDMYASIDLVTDKLERQIRKYKTKSRWMPRRQSCKWTCWVMISSSTKMLKLQASILFIVVATDVMV